METATISVSYAISRLTDFLLFPEVPFDLKLFLEHDEIDLVDEVRPCSLSYSHLAFLKSGVAAF